MEGEGAAAASRGEPENCRVRGAAAKSREWQDGSTES